MKAIVDDATEVQYPAQAVDRLAWAVIELINYNPPLAGITNLPELASVATAVATARAYFTIITTTYPAYQGVQWGSRGDTVGESAQAGIEWLNLNYPSTTPVVARSLSRAAAMPAALTPLPKAYPSRPAQLRE
jgi:hypothetical protein